MFKKEFTQYPHHTDPYAKHRITDEELDFLYELQKEMNTQHSDMLTYPRIWVIQEPIKNYLDNVETDLRNDPDAVEYLNQIADGADLCIDCINITTPQQLYQTIQSIIKDNSLEEKYQVELINNYKVLIHGKNDIGKTMLWEGSLEKIQKNGLLAIVEWVMGYTYHHAELRYYTKELYQRPGIFFLTYKDGVRYLQKYADKYDKDVKLIETSPMDLFTDCSPEIKKLFDILHTVDFSKKNRKVYISGKITKTEDYQERFDVAARELLAQGYEVVNPAYEGTKLENASYEDYMRLSFQLLKDCDIIYMLKGWETSPGANQEFGYALAKAMEIRFEK